MSRKFSDQFLCSRMMLPEHREGLNRRTEQITRQEKYTRPLWDEQQWEQFQLLLQEALEQRLVVEIVRVKEEIHESIIGTLKKADNVTGLIFVQTENKITKVKSEDVLSLQLMDRPDTDENKKLSKVSP